MFVGLFLFPFVTFIILTLVDSTDYISKHDVINWIDESKEKNYGIDKQVEKILKRNDIGIGAFKIKRDTFSAINTTSTTPIIKNASIKVIEHNATLDSNLNVKLKAITSNKRKNRFNMIKLIQRKPAGKRRQTTKRKNKSKRRQTTKRKQATKYRTTPKKKLTTKRKTTSKKKLTTKRITTPKRKLNTKPKRKLTTKRRTTPKTTPKRKLTTKHITTSKKKSTTKRRTTPNKILTTTTVKTTTSSKKPSSGNEIDSLRRKYLDQTNKYRRLHGSPDLTNSQKLENLAQAYAEKLANEFSGQLIHDPDQTYGENLAYMPSTMIDDPVKLWYDEVKNYDFNNPGFGMNTGHFTQLVWKNTKEMGCGIGRINQKNNGFYYYIISCKYNPPGNYPNQFNENVLPKED
uniref:SCP domain-containing protein n=2 Tax=Strongyloides papillosus TaxID=174720 RepID=A0A0N5CH25_STREA